jgi:hypothetical protein
MPTSGSGATDYISTSHPSSYKRTSQKHFNTLWRSNPLLLVRGGGVEYLHRNPESLKGDEKGSLEAGTKN